MEIMHVQRNPINDIIFQRRLSGGQNCSLLKPKMFWTQNKTGHPFPVGLFTIHALVVLLHIGFLMNLLFITVTAGLQHSMWKYNSINSGVVMIKQNLLNRVVVMAHPITDPKYVVLAHHDVLKLFIRGSFLFPLEMQFLKQSITFKKIFPFYYEQNSGEKLFH